MQKTKSLMRHLIAVSQTISGQLDALLIKSERALLSIWRHNPFSFTWCVFAALYVVFSLYGLFFWCQNSRLGDAYPRTAYNEMINGVAFKPFVYRQLIPSMTRIIVDITPKQMQIDANEAIEHYKNEGKYWRTKRFLPWLHSVLPEKHMHYSRVVSIALVYVFLLGYMAALYLLARALFPASQAIALFAPLIGIYAFSSFSYPWQYIYDIPTLFLSTACFYFILKQQNRHLILVFFLACVNKETAVFSLLFFTLWSFNRMETRRFIKTWAVLAAIYITVKTAVSIYYLNNRGWFLEGNLSWVLGADVFGSNNITKIIYASVFFVLIAYKWQEKPLFLKRTLWILPLIYIGYVFHGNPHEYRVFFDMHGPLVLLATHTLVAGTGLAGTSVFQKPLLTWPTRRKTT